MTTILHAIAFILAAGTVGAQTAGRDAPMLADQLRNPPAASRLPRSYGFAGTPPPIPRAMNPVSHQLPPFPPLSGEGAGHRVDRAACEGTGGGPSS